MLNFPGQIEPILGFSSTHCQDPPFLGSTKRKCPSVHSIRHPSTSSPRVLSQKKPYSKIVCNETLVIYVLFLLESSHHRSKVDSDLHIHSLQVDS